MGTRGLVGHIVRGRKKASYNHFDSYPSGLGIEIVRFIKDFSAEQISTMIENFSNIEWIDGDTKPSDENQARYTAAGFFNLEVNKRSTNDWHCLLHKMQGTSALPRILDGTLGHLSDNTDFEQDKLFCKWAYWIDWEQQTIKVSGRCDLAETTVAALTEEWMLAREASEESDEYWRNQPEGL